MKITATKISGVFLIAPEIIQENGFEVMESFNLKAFHEKVDAAEIFVQDNHSLSKKGVLRGLHYQIENPQGKLVRVLRGGVYDVIVDLRKSSPTYGKWEGHNLTGENRLGLWVPQGCAHGFLVLTDEAEFMYKTTNFWDAKSERCILWSDPTLNIAWPNLGFDPIVSLKDSDGLSWQEAPKFS